MATLPEASVTLNSNASAFAGGTGYCVVMAPVAQNADSVPRVFASTQDLLTEYKYAPGIDYCALHFQVTRKPIIFIGLPITTPGVVQSLDTSGVTGTSAITVAVGSVGSMEQCDAQVVVLQGGTVGTDQIILSLSLDNGVTFFTVRLGTATSYTIPNVGQVVNFGPGTLNATDVARWYSTAPMWGATAISAARTALAGQQNLARSWMVIGNLPNSTFAGYVVTEANSYSTANQRFTFARAQTSDRYPLAHKSKFTAAMVGSPSVTFAASGHTITRATGSWITDGFATGQVVSVAGSTLNNGVVGVPTAVSATVLTFTTGVVNEGPLTTGLSVVASEAITFASAGQTATRSAGSWITDGFVIGQSVAFSGTASNNATFVISALSATVLTASEGIVNEGPLPSSAVTAVQVLPFSVWVAAQTAAFATIDAQKHIDLGLGFAKAQSPITGYSFRRPAQWAVSIREYQHDVQIPTYRKADGPLDGFSLTDTNGNTIEFDERFNGGGLAGRFTCLRSYGNGPLGAFVALSLTRDSEGSLLSRTHNMAVADLACTVVQAETENAIGQVLILKSDGTGTDASLSLIEGRVNDALQINLLQRFAEGPRASSAVWTASRTDILNTVGATLNGNLALELDGTLENIATSVNILTGAGA